ncbi:hybrid sensor histidine kinase/response regulator [uncultured Roseobacter sp.]|uniref:sensor histidine kinase n=1 Tax=uncultured Roseobacter sp. TaxID=114847 RepID=UPI002613BA8D|nr:hybrid sensor histidine kinase/response regulator [uncultured Roseobacter sp.]
MNTLLIVDDDPEDREAIIRSFARDHDDAYKVLEAHDEASCFACLSENTSIDCILLDYSMPGCDGLQLLSKVLKDREDLTVVMITGEGSEDIAVKALKLGAQDYVIKKTISQIDIKRRVAHAIERKDMAKRLARQQQGLRDFADILVHDLRAPLRSIRGPIEILTQTDTPVTQEMREELHQFITDGVEHMDRLVVSLHAFSNAEKTKTSFGSIDAKRLLETVQRNLQYQIEKTGAKITLEIGVDRIWGAPDLLAQLLQNVVENGIKYNTSNPPSVHVSLSEDAEAWRVSVSDNGIGIEEQFREEIFEPFKRLHTQTAYSGSGLGLATCRRIAELHSAELHCVPYPSGGTEFILKLPKPVASD